MDKDYEDFNPYELASLLASQQALAQGVQQLAMRPYKTSQKSTTTSTSTPRALADLIKTRDTIGGATTDLASALRGRENWGYALGNLLSGIQADSTPGGWLAGLARGAGAGLTTMENLKQDTAKQLYDARMQDLANRLAYDKAMGETQMQRQEQEMGYTEMSVPASGKSAEQIVQQPEAYDVSKPEMPEKPVMWTDIDIQGQRVDPSTNVPTVSGLIAKYAGMAYEPEARYSKNANQQAYTETFTVPTITKVAKAAGGSRGIDTIPEVNLKGGPELSSVNMNSNEFVNAVKDKAWDAADQIIKANPNATITREELADAIINNFNHRVRKEYRIVTGFNTQEQYPATKAITPAVSGKYDYSKYGF